MLKNWQDKYINQVVCGDCLELLKELPDRCVDLIVTDPPYKLSQEYGSAIESDNLIAVSRIIKALPEVSRLLKDTRFASIFYDNRILPFLFDALAGTGLVYKRQIFLYRRWGNAHQVFSWMACTDPVVLLTKGFGKPFESKEPPQVKHDCYVKSSPESDSSGHPAQKPIGIVSDLILSFSDPGDLILDPFAGSGTTCVAAKQLGRKYIGIEIEPKYVAICKERLKQEQLPL